MAQGWCDPRIRVCKVQEAQNRHTMVFSHVTVLCSWHPIKSSASVFTVASLLCLWCTSFQVRAATWAEQHG